MNPLQAAFGGNSDAFVAKLNAAGSALLYSTYLGGSDQDYALGIAVDESGSAYVTGYTSSANFPTANPLQAALGGGPDAFVAKLNPSGSALVYSTYLGGPGSEDAVGIAVDASGNAYVVGITNSLSFPTANPLQAQNGGNGLADAFVAKLDAAGSALLYSTYLGGDSTDQGEGIAVDTSGNAYVTGFTCSANFPTANALQAALRGACDVFVTKLNAAGSALVYSTYLGGSGEDESVAIAVDSSGNAYVTGRTDSTNFPTANPIQATFGGGVEAAFVAKLGVALLGGDLSITKAHALGTAVVGNPVTYTITVTNGGPDPVGGAVVTDTFPITLMGVTWTCSASAGSICGAASGSGSINQTVSLLMGGTATFIASGTLNINASGTLSNTATVTPPAGIADPNMANNTATDTNIVTCASVVVVVVPDGRLADIAVPSCATAWFGATVTIGSSYSVEFNNTTGSVSPGALTVLKGDDSCAVSTLTTNDTSSIDPSGTGGLARTSFTATGTERFFQAKLVNTTGGPATLTFGWSETSLFSPAWSTNGSFNAYYSFQNTTGADLGGTLTLVDLTGGVLATFPVSVPAGQTASTNTLSLGVARNRTGTARFTHNGPPGSIVMEAAIANFTLNPAYVQPVKFQPAREAR